MTADDAPTDDTGDENADDEIEPDDVRAELDRQRSNSAATDAVNRTDDDRSEGTEEFDEGIVELLSTALDTDRAARVYVEVRRRPSATAEEIAAGTGLYPDSVREMLAELRDDDVVERHTRTTDSEDDAFEYTAIPPSELVGVMIDRVRDEFDTRLGLDPLPDGRSEPTRRTSRSDPVTITVEEADEASDETPASDETRGDESDDTSE
ncbi:MULTISPECIES: hypothetical protein [Halococcus]|uniref:Transcription regulator n=1 Tax=Halococcus salifodinae DSM 8989 TaxID=1227456 RepID=M0NGL9_9EURY|nr:MULTISPECIES: hypothetical protein [Halococcus]EMA55830.1 transcription regulator [Halococcus salifodinae DSM 8989]